MKIHILAILLFSLWLGTAAASQAGRPPLRRNPNGCAWILNPFSPVMSTDLTPYDFPLRERVGPGLGRFYRNFWNDEFGSRMRELSRFVDDFVNEFVDEDFLDPFAPRTNKALKRHLKRQNKLLREGGNETIGNLTASERAMVRRPEFDWQETDQGYMLTALTPGLKKDEINVEIVDTPRGDHMLVISGGTKKEDRGDNWHTSFYEKFHYKIPVPPGVHKNGIDAKYEEGALTVNVKVPKDNNHKKVEKIKIA